MEQLSGLIGIIANDSARYSLFSSCVTRLDKPEGWQLEWLIGGDWCGARNTLAEITLEEGFSHLWFMDDDHAFPPSILNRLLAHDLPLVVPVCMQRVPPFAPVTYTDKLDENTYLPLYLPEHPDTGLVKLEGGGSAGMLIAREVLEATGPDWFEYGKASEDLIFCEKAKAAGFDIYCDLSIRLGHISTAVVWPAQVDSEWVVGFTIGRDYNLYAPIEAKV